mgnify:CR=1 FL=1
MKLIREFKCDLTGTNVVIHLNAFGEDVARRKEEYLELMAYIKHEHKMLDLETA